MKMICDVPDEVIKSVKDGTWCGSYVAEKMIANGIPLPKGHGRLIDLNDLYDFDRRKVEYAPTIIEADKAEGSDKE